MRQILSCCCAKATAGTARTPPASAPMNVRRSICRESRRRMEGQNTTSSRSAQSHLAYHWLKPTRTDQRLQWSTTRHDRSWPRWNGHRPPSGDEGQGDEEGALQDPTASMCQSGVATQPLEERRARNECYDIWLRCCKARVPDVLGRRTNR